MPGPCLAPGDLGLCRRPGASLEGRRGAEIKCSMRGCGEHPQVARSGARAAPSAAQASTPGSVLGGAGDRPQGLAPGPAQRPPRGARFGGRAWGGPRMRWNLGRGSPDLGRASRGRGRERAGPERLSPGRRAIGRTSRRTGHGCSRSGPGGFWGAPWGICCRGPRSRRGECQGLGDPRAKEPGACLNRKGRRVTSGCLGDKPAGGLPGGGGKLAAILESRWRDEREPQLQRSGVPRCERKWGAVENWREDRAHSGWGPLRPLLLSCLPGVLKVKWMWTVCLPRRGSSQKL